MAAIPRDVFDDYLNTEPNPTLDGALAFASSANEEAITEDEGEHDVVRPPWRVPRDTPGAREILASDTPDLFAQVEAGTMTLQDAWQERLTRIRLTDYLVDRVTPLLGKSDPAELVSYYTPRFAQRKIGLAELDEAIDYLQELRAAMALRVDLLEAPDAS